MTIKNITSAILFPVLILGLLTSVFGVNYAHAQKTLGDLQCPLDGFVEVQLSSAGETNRIENIIKDRVILKNPSSYTMPGFKVGIAVFENETTNQPSYWTVLPGDYQVDSLSSVDVPFEIDASALPAGTYTIRAAAFQGDDMNLLGSAIRDAGYTYTQSSVVVKTTESNPSVQSVIKINEQTSNEQIKLSSNSRIKIEVSTVSNSSEILDNSLAVGLVMGDTPLGSAVRSSKTDSFNLIPGSSRITKLNDNFVKDGEYLVYVALTTVGKLQPVLTQSLKIGQTVSEANSAYISQVGIDALPFGLESQIVSCINYLGKDAKYLTPTGLIGVESVLTKDGKEVYSERLSNLEGDKEMFFQFNPKLKLNDFDLEVSLLENKLGIDLKAEAEPLAVLNKVQTIKGSLVCEADTCGEVQVTETLSSTDNSEEESFLFYIGVMLAALLLMYIMLKRLPPEKNNLEDALSAKELN